MSHGSPLWVNDYPNSDYDFDSLVDYDPSTSLPPLDLNTDFACLGQDQTGQDEQQASSPQPFSNEQGRSTGCDDVDSDSSGIVDYFGDSLNDDSELQGYFAEGESYSLENLDLSTPVIPSTPHSYFDSGEDPIHQESGNVNQSSAPTEHASASSSKDSRFECRHCGKTFDDKSKFKAHVKYHDKSHRCPDCDKSFGVKEQLKRHWKEVHEKRRILCPVRGCKKGYSRISSVKRHLSNKHGALDAEELLRPMKLH